MDLAQIYFKQDQDKDLYNSLRDKSWAEMKLRHENLISAFQTKENLPKGYAENFDKEVSDFNREWSIPDGARYKAMVMEHQQQIKAVVSKLEPANDKSNEVEQGKEKGFINRLSGTKILEQEEKELPSKDVSRLYQKNKDDFSLDKNLD